MLTQSQRDCCGAGDKHKFGAATLCERGIEGKRDLNVVRTQ